MTGRGHLDPEPGALRTPPLCADSSAEQKRASPSTPSACVTTKPGPPAPTNHHPS